MAIYKLSTGNLLVTLTAWSPHGLVEGQVQIEPDCSEYPLLEPNSVPMMPADEASFRLLRGVGMPFLFRPWRIRSKKRRAGKRR